MNYNDENYYSDLTRYLNSNYGDYDVLQKRFIANYINEKNINDIIENFDTDIINKDMKKLLKMFLLERRKRMLEIYNLKDEV